MSLRRPSAPGRWVMPMKRPVGALSLPANPEILSTFRLFRERQGGATLRPRRREPGQQGGPVRTLEEAAALAATNMGW